MSNLNTVLEEISSIDQALDALAKALLPLDKRKSLRNELKSLNTIIEEERRKEQTLDQRVHLKNLLTNRQNILQQLHDNEALLKQRTELLEKRSDEFEKYRFYVQQIDQAEECVRQIAQYASNSSSALRLVVQGILAVDLRNFSTLSQFETFKQSVYKCEEARKYIQWIQNNLVRFENIKTATKNFVAMNLRKLSTLSELQSLKKYACQKAGFSNEILYQLSSADKIKSGISEQFNRQLNLFIDLFSEFLDADKTICWLICFHEIYQSLVIQLSDNWSIRYPQFENIMSKEASVEQYVCLEFSASSKECFQFACWLLNNNILTSDIEGAMQQIESDITATQKDNEVSKFRAMMLSKCSKTATSITLEIIDGYDGIEFEKFVGTLFESDGYKVSYTLASNDKGIDIIARRNGVSIGIQCKCYSSKVGISAVQEVFSGKNFYTLDKALVVTNNYFTTAAKDLAVSTGVILWDRDILRARTDLL